MKTLSQTLSCHEERVKIIIGGEERPYSDVVDEYIEACLKQLPESIKRVNKTRLMKSKNKSPQK